MQSKRWVTKIVLTLVTLAIAYIAVDCAEPVNQMQCKSPSQQREVLPVLLNGKTVTGLSERD